jgi:hypothetical protein
MAFKMKGPSLLKMVENERKNSPLNKNGDEPKLTMSDLGNLATKGAKAIQAGIKSFSDSQLMNIIKRNVDAFSIGRLKKGEEYRSPEALQNIPNVNAEDIAIRSDSTRAAMNELFERYPKGKFNK